jgi:hypothetical protein
MTARTAALILLGLTGLAMLFHLALILGAPWGELTMGGRWDGTLPLQGRVASALSILVLALSARAVAERAELARAVLPAWSIRAVVAFLILAAVMNTVTPSAAERLLWLPQILVQLVCALRLARSG